jgi:diketogulonate reductase-like aldo/keto reductase
MPSARLGRLAMGSPGAVTRPSSICELSRCLTSAVQRGVSLVPKTSSIARLKENISIFDFQLSVSCVADVLPAALDASFQADDCAAIDSLNRNHRYNNPGDFANYPIYD